MTLAKDFFINSKFAARLRGSLRALNIKVIAADECAAPNVITFELPRHLSSEVVGKRLEDEGYLLSYRSAYLLERN